MASWRNLLLKLQNVAGVVVNPATDDTLQSMLTRLANIDTDTLQAVVLLTALSGQLPSSLLSNRLRVGDQLTGFEPLADQNGAGGVLTFTFANGAPDLIWVRSVGGISRADPSGGTPTATLGVYCADGEPAPITKSGSSTLKIFAPTGATVSVWGYRYS